MKNKVIGVLSFLALPLLALPMVVFAQDPQLGYFEEFFVQLQDVLDFAIPVVFALALLFFFWGVALFVLAAGDDEKRQQGKKIMLWGVIALLVIASIWGIVALLQNVFDIGDVDTVTPPTVNF